jgi:hypothetical protein
MLQFPASIAAGVTAMPHPPVAMNCVRGDLLVDIFHLYDNSENIEIILT